MNFLGLFETTYEPVRTQTRQRYEYSADLAEFGCNRTNLVRIINDFSTIEGMLRESLRISYESVTSMTITCANNKYS